MRGQNHVHRRKSDRQTDGQTDGQGETNIPPPKKTLFVGGIIIKVINLLVLFSPCEKNSKV